jgi:transcriptional regulator with XRE-family HTH domain
MEPKERFSELLKKYQNDAEYIAEGIMIDITEQIVNRMEEGHMTRIDLARKLKCSSAYITKLLKGSQNMTIKKLVDVGLALGCKIDFALIGNELEIYRMFKYKKPERIEFDEEIQPSCSENCESNISVAA